MNRYFVQTIHVVLWLVLISGGLGNRENMCSRIDIVVETYAVRVQDIKIVWKRNWFRGDYSERIPYWKTVMRSRGVPKQNWECCFGYYMVQGRCVPHCYPPCLGNSTCTTPNKCVCNVGYSQSNFGIQPAKCQPQCDNECPVHSQCIEPNKCECVKGYVFASDGGCRPVCTGGCPENSGCVSPNICQCKLGYVSNVTLEAKNNTSDANTTKQTNVIEATSNQYVCLPFCSEGCGPNRHCAAPFQCECDEGYQSDVDGKGNNSSCHPVCSIGCPAFSSCAEPEVCQCHDGYQMNPDRTQCDPICANGCPEHSVCLRPDLCQCDDGWRKQSWPTGEQRCEPICELDCSAYGLCVAPGVCECLPGYEAQSVDPSGPLCRPVCSRGCLHGICFQPEICVCDPGYLMGPNDTCAAVCSLGCKQGRCVEPEICACNEGYRLQFGSVHICDPICTPDCESGVCVAPDVCICWNEFEPHPNDSHVCLPSTTSTMESITVESTTADSNTAGSTASSTWSISTESDSAVAGELQQCLEQCACWLESGGIIDKCHHLCTDDHDQPCLDPRHCRCNWQQAEMVCSASEKVANVESYGDDYQDYVDHMAAPTTIVYRCHVRRLVDVAATTDGSGVQLRDTKPRDANGWWWWWIVCAVITLMVLLCVVLRYRHSHLQRAGETDAPPDLAVRYDNMAS